MKLVSYRIGNSESFGMAIEEGVVDLKEKLNHQYVDLKSFLAHNDQNEIKVTADDVIYTLDEITLLPVIPNPEKIICVGLNYRAHVEEVGASESPFPTLFFRVPSSQIGHQVDLVIPKESSRFDYEGEIAVIIGKGGRRIREEEAYDHIAGYACYNDGSIRDWQLRTSQWGPGKNFDGTGSFGPWMVTRGEIQDGEVLTLKTRINGEVMQNSSTDRMIFSIPKLIAFISTFTTLQPGDVIVSGTPGGVGDKREPQVYLKDGDIVEVEVSKIGTLSNPVVAE